MVRAGRGGKFIDDFIENNMVAIGWVKIGQPDNNISRDELLKKVEKTWPELKNSQRAKFVSTVFRYLSEIKVGDRVVSYDSGKRIYNVGTIESNPFYDESLIPELPRCRKVKWEGAVERDLLSIGTKNTLGAISTLFKLSDSATDEIEKRLSGKPQDTNSNDVLEEDVDDEGQLDSIKLQSKEFIKDRIIKLDTYEFQDLVAGVLRAMGYKTSVSAPGPDRGVDILASPDGFGFEQPRIVVECKHRSGAMGSQQIRSFLGGRHKDDKGLYVSTGGFSKDARYEAERANIPVTLMDIDQLVDAVIEHYENMDTETRVLLPLVKLYWPV